MSIYSTIQSVNSRRTPVLPVLLTVAGLLFASSTTVRAHVPHDDVSDIELSPNFSNDRTIFATVRGVLFRSTDGGYEWHRLFRGLGSCPRLLTELAIAPDYPTDPTLFVACNAGGVFRSDDGGLSWEEADDGLRDQQIVHFAISPQYGIDSSILAMSDDGMLYRSSNAGRTWTEVSDLEGLSSLEWSTSGLMAGTQDGVLYRSLDAGATWSAVQRLPDGSPITAIVTSNGGNGEFLVFLGVGPMGTVWTARLGGDSDPERLSSLGSAVMSLASLNEDGRSILLASTWESAVHRSEDMGRTWETFGRKLMISDQADEHGIPHFTTIAVADDSTLFLATFCGPFRSDDRGFSWHRLEVTLHHIVGLDVAATASGHNSILIGTYGVGAYSIDEGGEGWRVHNRGLPSPRLGAVTYSPQFAEDSTLFASSYSRVLKSTDAGRSWSVAVLRESGGGIERIKTLVRWFLGRSEILREKSWFRYLRPEEGAFSEALVFALSPAFQNDNTLYIGAHPGGLWRSLDGGASFELVWQTRSDVRSLVISPQFPEDRTLFAALRDGRVFRSRNGGSNWRQIGRDLPLGEDGRATVAISPDFGRDLTLFAGGTGGLFKSIDAGSTWRRLEAGEFGEDGPVSAIAVSPSFTSDRQLLVQVKGGHLWVCRDRADRFEAAPSHALEEGYGFFQLIGRESAPLIKYSPDYSRDRTVYGASVYHLVRSTDGGMTWTSIPRTALRLDSEATLMPWYFIPVYLEGEWNREANAEHSSSGAIYSAEAGSKLTMDFVGTGVMWIGTRGPDRGRARVFIDDVMSAEIDQYGPSQEYGVTVYSASDLEFGPHTLTIEVLGSANESSSGHRVDSDAIDIIQRPTASRVATGAINH